jgi:23S rRNA pseudouridine955/2504/2580 synthase
LDKFKNREIEKYYKATVYGILPKKQDRLEAYLFKDNKKSLVYISDVPKKGYQKIITSYKVIEEDKLKNTSVLDIKLETGRTHQIRAHLAHIGYPIVGDR